MSGLLDGPLTGPVEAGVGGLLTMTGYLGILSAGSPWGFLFLILWIVGVLLAAHGVAEILRH